MEKILALAKKLKALADQGVGGEKTTAMQMLEKFMAKHNIKPEDLSDDIRKRREFKITDVQFKFFQQIVAHVCGKDYSIKYDPRKKYSVRKPYWVELTDLQYVEVSSKFDFYWKVYEEQLGIFYSAFIQKNRLWRERTDDDGEQDLTPEELDRLMKVMMMAQSIEKAHFVKQLKHK